MRFLPPIIAWLSVVAASFAEITIEVPSDPVSAGQHIQVFVRGIAQVDLPKAVVKHWPRTNTVFIAAKSWGGDPFVWFSGPPGKYLIFVSSGDDYAETVIVVGGPQPDPFPQPFPNPDPSPDPQPFPISQLSVVILCETQTRTGDETLALFKIRAYASQAQLAISIVDQDLISGSTNKAPPWLEPWSEALNTSRVQVPALLIGSTVGGVLSVVAVEPLTTGDAAIELVKKWGG